MKVFPVNDISDIIAALVVIDDEIEDLQEDVDAIEALVSAIGILEETGGELTTDGTEQNVYINNAPAGVYKPIWFIMDFANQTVTETIVMRTYYRIAPAGPWVVEDRETFVGIPTLAGVSVGLHPARYGIRITVEKTAGTNRAYDWEVFYEV